MLKYINQLPSQETFQPPPLPCVSLSVDENDVKYHDLTIQEILFNITCLNRILSIFYNEKLDTPPLQYAFWVGGEG